MSEAKFLTAHDYKVIRQLRQRGFAVIVWTPEELDGVSPKSVEERSVELGWNAIDDLRMYATVENKEDE